MNDIAFHFHEVGRLPAPDDNAAIATRTLEPGTVIDHDGQRLTLRHTVLEGHRFAVRTIKAGDGITSWGQTFGIAIRDIAPGHYVCNQAVLTALNERSLAITLPDQPNFADQVPPFVFDEAHFSPAPPLSHYQEQRTFMGYRRAGGRGVGTRNFIVLLGTTSVTGGFVRAAENHLKGLAANYPNVDGIVAVAHTEGGHQNLNNKDLLLRTLAGFMVNPNVGAVLAVDYGSEPVTNAMLQAYMQERDYPLEDVPHRFLSLTGSFQDGLDTTIHQVEEWLPVVNAVTHAPVPLSDLKIGLQCGGSDAFSGISGNPLVGWVTKEIIHYGGSVNLAETDELVNAENYVLHQVRNLETARQFLSTLDRFQTWAGWHGHSIFGNPSGGNLFRGLYNIYLKSLGAATKKHPDTRLDYVIEYGQPMTEPGFYFMDSPGNDLESVAGQVAAGCNLIFFTTGNGSITNFPFVPTIKVVTTTQRYNLLSQDMDVNAGAYLDGTPLQDLGRAMLDLSIKAASGEYTVGEKAGHSQVQIWRDWRMTQPTKLEDVRPVSRDGLPLPIKNGIVIPEINLSLFRTPSGLAADQIGLILPTSLCAGQIARMCAQSLNDMGLGQESGLSRFVGLAHTEGCGSSRSFEYIDTLIGYLQHPFVQHALLLEHGCEVTHNSYLRGMMREAGLEPDQFGYASIQLDGGIESVTRKVAGWFADQIAQARPPQTINAGLGVVRLGLLTDGDIPPGAAHCLAQLTRMIVSAGGTVILPSCDGLLTLPTFTAEVVGQQKVVPTMNYAHRPLRNGLHVMDTPLAHWGEMLTGLGAAGVEVILAFTSQRPLGGHPFIPVLYSTHIIQDDVDLMVRGENDLPQILGRIAAVLSRQIKPDQSSNVNFQVTRGWLGVSL